MHKCRGVLRRAGDLLGKGSQAGKINHPGLRESEGRARSHLAQEGGRWEKTPELTTFNLSGENNFHSSIQPERPSARGPSAHLSICPIWRRAHCPWGAWGGVAHYLKGGNPPADGRAEGPWKPLGTGNNDRPHFRDLITIEHVHNSPTGHKLYVDVP